MTNLHRKFATNLGKETTGVLHDLGDGIKITVARLNNPEHVAAMERLRAPYKDRLELGVPIDDEDWRRISARAMAETILIGWEGVKDAAGNDVPYTIDEAEKILLDKEMKDFTAVVLQKASIAANYRKYSESVTEKNSGRKSAGRSNGENTSRS